MTVTRLRREMPEPEFNDWIAYYSVEAKLRKDAADKAKNTARPRRRRHR